MAQTCTKQPSESRLYSMDFSPNLAESETLSSVTTVTGAPTGLTIGTAAVDSTTKKAQFRVSAGTAGQSYKITVVVLSSASNILEGEGILVVRDN